MTEPTTYAGYKVGTLLAMMMGVGVSAGLTPGPWYARALAGLAGGGAAFVMTPLFAPLALKLFGALYGWAGVAASDVPHESIVGFTGFVLALIGIDLCRWLIDASRKLMARIPLAWPKTPSK